MSIKIKKIDNSMSLINKKDEPILFKVVKQRWYHKYFEKPSNGVALCELSGLKLFITHKGKYYLDIDSLTVNVNMAVSNKKDKP